jgi:hypothetical protein
VVTTTLLRSYLDAACACGEPEAVHARRAWAELRAEGAGMREVALIAPGYI